METTQQQFLTAKQVRFCDEYLLDRNATQAALRAGYSGSTAESGYLMGNPLVHERIAQKTEQAAAVLPFTYEQVLLELGKIAFSNIEHYYNNDGTFKVMDEIGTDAKAALAGIDFTRVYTGKEDGKQKMRESIRIRMHNKLRALDMLGKHLAPVRGKAGVEPEVDDYEFLKYLDPADMDLGRSPSMSEDGDLKSDGGGMMAEGRNLMADGGGMMSEGGDQTSDDGGLMSDGGGLMSDGGGLMTEGGSSISEGGGLKSDGAVMEDVRGTTEDVAGTAVSNGGGAGLASAGAASGKPLSYTEAYARAMARIAAMVPVRADRYVAGLDINGEPLPKCVKSIFEKYGHQLPDDGLSYNHPAAIERAKMLLKMNTPPVPRGVAPGKGRYR